MSSMFTEQGIVILSAVLRSDIAIQVRIKIMDSLPVMNDDGEIIEYNVYQAVLIVRYSADGKLYLYDIQNIKKETRYPSWTNLSDGQKPASSENDCNTFKEKSKYK